MAPLTTTWPSALSLATSQTPMAPAAAATSAPPPGQAPGPPPSRPRRPAPRSAWLRRAAAAGAPRCRHRERGGGQSRIFAKRMSGHVIGQSASGRPPLRLDHPDHRHADRHQRRLRVAGQDQLVLRPLEHQPRQRLAQRAVDRRENLARLGEIVGQVAAHADRLTPLPRTYKRASRSRPIIPVPPCL